MGRICRMRLGYLTLVALEITARSDVLDAKHLRRWQDKPPRRRRPQAGFHSPQRTWALSPMVANAWRAKGRRSPRLWMSLVASQACCDVSGRARPSREDYLCFVKTLAKTSESTLPPQSDKPMTAPRSPLVPERTCFKAAAKGAAPAPSATLCVSEK